MLFWVLRNIFWSISINDINKKTTWWQWTLLWIIVLITFLYIISSITWIYNSILLFFKGSIQDHQNFQNFILFLVIVIDILYGVSQRCGGIMKNKYTTYLQSIYKNNTIEISNITVDDICYSIKNPLDQFVNKISSILWWNQKSTGNNKDKWNNEIRVIPYYPYTIHYKASDNTIHILKYSVSINNIPKDLLVKNSKIDIAVWLIEYYKNNPIIYKNNIQNTQEIIISSVSIHYSDKTNFKDFLKQIKNNAKLHEQFWGGSKEWNILATILKVIIFLPILLIILFNGLFYIIWYLLWLK